MDAAVEHVEAQRVVLPRDIDERAAGRRAEADPAAHFAELVRQSFDGPVLRYAQRLRLVKLGRRLGIGRFEANLIIARVLHREGMGQETEMSPTAGGWLGAVATFLIVQGLIVAGAWWVMR